MNTFRELKVSIELVQKMLQTKQNEQSDFCLEEKKLEALFEIKNYVLEMSWITQKRTKERIHVYLRNQCNIQKTAEHYHVKANTIYVAINYASKKLTEKIGTNTIKKLYNVRMKVNFNK